MKQILQILTLTTASLTFNFATAWFNPSQAATINYTIEVSIDSGSLSGNNYFGSFSYDNSSLTGSGEEFIDVSDVSFNFDGTNYTVANNPQVAFLDGKFLGLSYSPEPSLSFIPGFFDVSEAYFAYDFGSFSSGFGDVTYTLQNTSVPEPTTVISLVAVGAWGVTSRLKRKARTA
ncbi:MAG TPA: PEP-CTERM sorting domain-containing protein [Leptolyngbyaceae cyanobacterium]